MFRQRFKPCQERRCLGLCEVRVARQSLSFAWVVIGAETFSPSVQEGYEPPERDSRGGSLLCHRMEFADCDHPLGD